MNTVKNVIIPLMLLVGAVLLALPDSPNIPLLTCDISENVVSPVQLPCWDSITPGITTQAEAHSQLTARYGANNVTQDMNILRWTAPAGRLSGSGDVYIDPQYMTQSLRVVLPASQLTLTSLIERTGEPEQVVVVRAFSSTVYCAGAILSFPNRGIHAYLYPEGNSVGVSAAQSIQILELMTPEKAQSWSMTDTATIPWQGYADYCALTGWDK